MDLNKNLAPVTAALKAYRYKQQVSGAELSTKAGKTRTWITELESGRGTVNPSLGRLIDWAQGLGVQEFGVYVVIDGEYTSAALLGDDEDV